MAISRSSEGSFDAGAELFSGRPNPRWTVSASVAKELEGIWNSLNVRSPRTALDSRLGYRGCFLRDRAGGEWRAFDGVVTHRSAGDTEARSDPQRTFEKALLRSAPNGLLPQGLLK